MAITRETLMNNLARTLGFFLTGNADANAGNNASLTDIAIIGPQDTNKLPGMWLQVLVGGTVASLQANQIASVSSGGALVMQTNFVNSADPPVAAAIDKDDTYRILPYHPQVLVDALAEAMRDVYPYRSSRGLYRSVVDESIIVDNLLTNFSFETSESTGSITAFASNDSTIENTTLVTDAGHGLSSGDTITISGTTNYNGTFVIGVVSSSTFYIHTSYIANDGTGTWVEGYANQEGTASHWTLSGTWTFPASTRRVHGKHVASCTSAGSAYQDLYTMVNVDGGAGRTLFVRAWAFASSADTARIRVSQDGGSTFTNGTYHSGKNEWEYLELDVQLVDDATSLRVILQAGTGDFFDLPAAWIGCIERYSLPLDFVEVNFVEQQVNRGEVGGLRGPGQFVQLGPNNPPRSGHLLRIRGMGDLTVPTTEYGAVEVSERQAEAIVMLAASYVNRNLQVGWEDGSQQRHERMEDKRARDASRLLERHGMKPQPSQYHDSWMVQDDGGVKELVLSRSSWG